ncbi:hypothetical protein HPB48_004872 [Haemaphysalis longicornis]|uniref:Uncharacterized protein n=1 Tax=Haemaphysalis longicornis TaxID=44386 RepID=A0A9J6H6M1_HAELO|nr:hypothetical protein HPB48_004872 [Haemaphysalis longicornis]
MKCPPREPATLDMHAHTVKLVERRQVSGECMGTSTSWSRLDAVLVFMVRPQPDTMAFCLDLRKKCFSTWSESPRQTGSTSVLNGTCSVNSTWCKKGGRKWWCKVLRSYKKA